MIKAHTLEVTCPTCQELTVFSSENQYRPFCSKRCQMIDLGDWADEKFRIPEAANKALDEEWQHDNDLY